MKDGQKTDVLWHMQNCGSITSMEAFADYGITRLSARIFELRKLGYNIERTDLTRKNRRGRTVRFAEYKLAKEI